MSNTLGKFDRRDDIGDICAANMDNEEQHIGEEVGCLPHKYLNVIFLFRALV